MGSQQGEQTDLDPGKFSFCMGERDHIHSTGILNNPVSSSSLTRGDRVHIQFRVFWLHRGSLRPVLATAKGLSAYTDFPSPFIGHHQVPAPTDFAWMLGFSPAQTSSILTLGPETKTE